MGELLALHGVKEFVIGFGIFEFIQDELGSLYIFHRAEQFAQNPHALQLFL